MSTLRNLFCCVLLCTAIPAVQGQTANSAPSVQQQGDALLDGANDGSFPCRPAGFEENKGQVVTTTGDPAPFVRYRLSQAGTNIFLLGNGIAYQFDRPHLPEGYADLKGRKWRTAAEETRLQSLEAQAQLETFRMDMILEGADPLAAITVEGRSEDYTNYYNHEALDVHTYTRIVYHEVYPGIDWWITSDGQGIEQDFIVRASADPSVIKLRFTDHEELFLDQDGNLIHGNRLGRFTEEKPVSIQDGAAIATAFSLKENLLTFELGDYDTQRELRIDPPRLWGTYYGGTASEYALSVDVASSGSIYLAGLSNSTNAIASPGAHQTTWAGEDDCMLVKFNASGVRQWGTYYGGALGDAFAFCKENGTFVYAAGITRSTSAIATAGAHQTTLGGDWDGLLVKFDTNGTRLWATYYGGSMEDRGRGCDVDPAGNVFMSGFTYSDGASVIASGGHQNTRNGDKEGFLVKFTSAGARIWGTYYGGVNVDEAFNCATDGSGNVYLCGGTGNIAGTAIATSTGHQPGFGGGGSDAYLAKFNGSGARQWGTYYGGSGDDYGFACAAESNGNVYFTGDTKSSGPAGAIASGGHQNTFGGGTNVRDAFFVKFNGSGARQWGTYYGGTDDDTGRGCTSDSDGNAYLIGEAVSTNAIASGGHQMTFGGGEVDGYLASFNPAGARTEGTYYGGTLRDEAYSAVVDDNRNVILCGRTFSTNAISTAGAYQPALGGSADAFLVKFGSTVDCQGVPDGPDLPGTSCGDENNCTANDTWSVACECVGTPVPGPTMGTVGGNSPLCVGDLLNLTASATGIGTISYLWTGPNTFGSGSQNPSISSVTVAATGTYNVSASNGCGTNATGSIAIIVNPQPTTATVGGGQSICVNGTTSGLGGNTPNVGTGTWSVVSGGTGTFSPGSTAPNATFTHTGGAGPVIVRWTISLAPCLSSSATVTLTINQPPSTATVGTPQTICTGGSTSGLGGNTPTIGTGQWTLVSGGSGTFNPSASAGNATFTPTQGVGPYLLRWTTINAPCNADTADVVITVNQPPSAASVGGTQTICANGTSTGLGGNAPQVGTGAWSVVGGGTGTFSSAGSPNATFTHTGGAGPVIVRWTISNAPCTASTANVTITISQPPTPANTGNDRTLCSGATSSGLGGNVPTVGTGLWSIVGGGTGSFNPNASAADATFTHIAGAGPVTVLWTISNAPCPAATDPLMISITPPPSQATVGGPQTICTGGTTTGLGANTPVVGTGAWAIISGGNGFFTPFASSPNATFTHTNGTGPIVLSWEIINGACPFTSASLTVTVNPAPTTATVGGGQTICVNGTTIGLGGNTPTTGTGVWSVVSGGTGTFSNAASPTATFTHTGGTGPVILRWTISNAPCTASTANVSITINQPPTVASTGGAQTICANGTSAALGGNTPANGTGAWSVLSGGTGTFSNAASPNATFTHIGGNGPVILRWTISNAPCTSSTADAAITINQAPSAATVGGGQTICVNGITTGLGGNTPTTGTGVWSVVSGGTGTFSNAASPTATFTHTGGTGPVILRWTISNAPCTASTANVSITINQPPTVASTGGAQTICANGISAALGGNTPANGTGAWSVVSGGTGTFSNAASPNATFTHTGGNGPVILRWTISNAPCTASTSDLNITITQPPTSATAGGPQTICANGTTSGLGGSTPAVGSGVWSIVSGGTGSFSNATLTNATFTHTGGAGPIIVRWTISNAPCAASTANVTITINQAPTTASAGNAQTICANGTTTGLGGNTPTVGTGTWTVVSGGTGTFSNAGSPNATFTHSGGPGPVIVRWTISNAPCTASTAQVTITINQGPTTASTGGAQTICASGTTTGLGGNTPTVGTGAWSVVGGGTGNFSNAASPNATYTHTGGAGPVVLRWTISNAPCAASNAETSVTITQPPATATVGTTQTICANATTAGLGGNTPTTGTGAWSVVSGGTGTFSNAASPNATFSHTSGNGPLVLRWTISNAPCSPTSANVSVIISPDTDGDGLCDVADNCPSVTGQVGSPCNDGNVLTINDALNALCNCIGTPVSCVQNSDCDDEDPCTTDACVSNNCVFTAITTDTDGDGIPDCADDCPTVDGEIGSACDDGDDCTVNDELNGNCICSGTDSGDTDGDGVCDAQDDCPTVTGEIGSTCNDNDPCTINDALNAGCDCVGTFSGDTDNDGICNAQDDCPNVPGEIGSPCNDGNNCTINDVLNASCLCAGTLDNSDTDSDGIANCNDDCPSVPGEIGSACNDNNACTVNDVLNAACQCVGTVDPTDTDGDGVLDCADSCPGTFGQVGSACDDDNVCTLNDVLNAGCVCSGTPDNTDSDDDGTPDCADNCPNVPGQVGSACNDNDPCTLNDVLNASCTCIGTVDNTDSDADGIPDCSDNCPNEPGEQGDACDDDDVLTINDQLNAVCLCVGLPVSCVGNNDCDDQDPCTTDACVSNACVFTAITTDSDGDGIPDCSDDCPTVVGEIGIACDDGDACTVNDVVNASCLCAGTPDLTDSDGDGVTNCADNCPTVSGQIGSQCDDGDLLTIGDELNDDCVCIGLPVSCVTAGDCDDSDDCTADDCVSNVCVYTALTADDDGDGFLNCEDPCPAVPGLPGSFCDDNDPCTTGDILLGNCVCSGSPDLTDSDLDGTPDCEDPCPTIPGVPGSACNDNDPCTVNDALNASCQCAGTPVAVGPITGDDSIDGWTTNTWTVPMIAGATYVWDLPEGWTSGNTTSSGLNATAPNGPNTVELCVTAFLSGCSLDTACLEIVVNESVGVDGPSAGTGIGFTVRPNPSRGVFELVRDNISRTPTVVGVVDATGRMILSRTLNAGQLSMRIDMGDTSAGVYFLRISQGEDTQVMQLVIER